MCEAVSSLPWHLPQLGLFIGPSLNTCSFTGQWPVSCPDIRSYCVSKTALRVHHTLSRQPYWRKVLCVGQYLQQGYSGCRCMLKTESRNFLMMIMMHPQKCFRHSFFSSTNPPSSFGRGLSQESLSMLLSRYRLDKGITANLCLQILWWLNISGS